MEIPRSEFTSAGFLVTREVERPSYLSAELLPDRIISTCSCIASFVPDSGCIRWAQDPPRPRIEYAEKFGLDPAALEEITAWATSRFGTTVRWPNVVSDLDAAKALVSRFLRDLPGVRVLELGLHRSMTDVFCQTAEPPPQKPGFAPIGREGVHQLILEGKPLTQSGAVLGFEPRVYLHILSCSWLCNHLETVVERALGIKPNRHGLLERFDDACACVQYISRDDVPSEPGLWLPWLIVDHTAEVQRPADAASRRG